MLQTFVSNVSSFFPGVCCKCVYVDVVYIFTYMLQVFYLDVVYVCNSFKCFSGVFASVSDKYFKCFIVLRRMLQLLYLHISKLDRVLHLPPRLMLHRLGVKCGKRGRQRWSPLARAVPMCMRERVAACEAATGGHPLGMQHQ
jgi:hypothetical protein